ncbi:tyrosine-type recombinase/integrase [Kaistia terrae]|uniref:Tyrosine-type recombinase/integrase n=1 Tax=Kaistia terrae TaxID=537017 RepID=A0ABW0Q3P3_9HYPH|nr:tyrosine-type recombinase/integrase [Kaistia terrae]MCX5580795.1 tyrosine-type recombinase/integrase [Kaistia terrae]
MVLQMARSTKRPGSLNNQFVRRIPADLLDRLKGRTFSFALPSGEIDKPDLPVRAKAGVHIAFSLQTSDKSLTTVRHAAALAQVEALFKAERAGPLDLSFKQIQALAGLARRRLIADNEDDPGRPSDWAMLRSIIADAAEYLDPDADGETRPLYEPRAAERALAAVFDIDAFLTSEGVTLARTSRDAFIQALTSALFKAASLLSVRATGDYSPDPNDARYPDWQRPEPPATRSFPAPSKPTVQTGKITLTALVEGWWTEAKATGRKPSTHESYRNTMQRLIKHLGHEDASRVTPEDVISFKDARLAEINPRNGKPISPKTVKGSDLAGLKVVFDWSVSNRKLGFNPASEVTLKLGKTKRTRGPGFTDEEALVILKHATAYQRGSERPATAAAKRWVPWLCAYTGGRVGELAQLRKQDIRQEAGRWILHITPDAGTVKTDEARDVPLHAHLIEQGFIDFVTKAKPGPLFLIPAKDGDVLGPLQGVKNRLAEFVREVFTDPRVAPNHGWRHRFKTVCRDMGIDAGVRDAIQGHAARSVAEEYGEVSIIAKSNAIDKLPRYLVE